jgi:hypothetical protein
MDKLHWNESKIKDILREFQIHLTTLFTLVVKFSITTQRLSRTLYVANYVDASTEEVYWLSTYIHKYNKRTSTQVVCRTVVILAQQEIKGWYYNNK